MNNRRAVGILLSLQLVGLLLLTQTWYSIAMRVNDSRTVLGDFQGNATYAITMPVTLFLLAVTLVVFLTSVKTTRILLAIQSLVTVSLAAWIGMQVFAANVSELDTQLDRLTGIAQTHGIAGVEITTTANPWFWVTIQCLATLLCGYLATRTKGWGRATSSRTKSSNKPRSSIDLWDSQRG